MRRVLYAMVALGLVPVLATAAGADTAASVTFTSPATDGATFTSPASLSGTVDRPDGMVDSVDVTVRWIDTVNRPPAPHPPQQATLVPATSAPSYAWSFTPQPAANGRYSVTVVATTQGSSSPQSQVTATRSYLLDVKPAVPTGVTASADAAQRTAKISWTANTEPDLIGYEVLRSGPASTDTAKVIGGVDAPATTYTDTDVAVQPAGTYHYSVEAVRQSADGVHPDISDASNAATVSFTTPPKSTAPPPPTTQTPQRSTPGSSTAPSSSGGRPSGTTSGASGPSFALPPPARASLSDYQNLVGQAQASTVTTEPPDPGFSSHLPYQPKTTTEVINVPGEPKVMALGPTEAKGDGVRKTFEFVAGGLVLAVLALFGLLLTRTAEQTLEPLAPAAAPEAVPPPPPAHLMLTMVPPARSPDPEPLRR